MRTGLLVIVTILAAPLARAQGVERRGEDSRRFENPRVKGQVVDRCLNWDSNCEMPAADNFCRLNGYARAARFRFAGMRPTIVAGDNKVCDEGYCQGFTTITCEGRGERATRGGRTFVDPRINGKLVDRCLNWGENCEQPAADNFCRQKGFSAAAAFEFTNVRPTLVVGDDKICNEDMCQGFTTITCR